MLNRRHASAHNRSAEQPAVLPTVVFRREQRRSRHGTTSGANQERLARLFATVLRQHQRYAAGNVARPAAEGIFHPFSQHTPKPEQNRDGSTASFGNHE